MSEMSLSEVLAELGRMGNFGRAVAKASEVAAALAGAEQAIREKTEAAARLQAANDQAKADLDVVLGQVAEARKVAADTIVKAEADAGRIRSDAKADATLMRSEADAEVSAAEARKVAIESEVSAAQRVRDELLEEVRSLESHIAKVKADALAALGA